MRSDLPSLRYFSSTFSVLALQDYYSGNATWSEKVVDGMRNYYRQYGVYNVPAVNSDSIYWGLAFFYAYRAYKQQALLDLAMAAYNATYTDAFITPDVVANGAGAGRGIPFIFSNCSDRTSFLSHTHTLQTNNPVSHLCWGCILGNGRILISLYVSC